MEHHNGEVTVLSLLYLHLFLEDPAQQHPLHLILEISNSERRIIQLLHIGFLLPFGIALPSVLQLDLSLSKPLVLYKLHELLRPAQLPPLPLL